MTSDIQPKDVVFIQRSNDNTAYGEVHISGSNVITYLDENGLMTAGDTAEFYNKFPVGSLNKSFSFTDKDNHVHTINISKGIITLWNIV